MFIWVKSSELKEKLAFIGPELRASEESKSIGLAVHDKRLWITMKTSLSYRASVAIVEEQGMPADFAITVKFADFSPIFSSQQKTKIEFSPVCAVLENKSCSATMSLSDAVVSEYIPEKEEPEELVDSLAITRAIGILQQTRMIDKILGREVVINFAGDIAYVHYGTVWLRVRSNKVFGSVTKRDAGMIKAFNPIGITRGNVLTFYNEVGDVLSIPATEVDAETTFMKKVGQMRSVTQVNLEGFKSKLQNAIKVAGKSGVMLCFTKGGIIVKINKADVRTSIAQGDDTNILFQFTSTTDYIQLITNIFASDTFEVLEGGDLVCLRNQNVAMILSCN